MVKTKLNTYTTVAMFYIPCYKSCGGWSGKVQRLSAVTIAGVRNVELQPTPFAYNSLITAIQFFEHDRIRASYIKQNCKINL